MIKMFFDNRSDFRIREEELDDIKKIVKADPERYKNISIFIRCCLIRFIRSEKARLRL